MDAEFSITIKPKRKEDIAHIIELLSDTTQANAPTPQVNEPKAEVKNMQVHYDDVQPEPTPEPARSTSQGYSCPVCKTPMVWRKGTTGTKFYGCSRYYSDKCHGTRDEYGNNTTKAN